MTIKIFRDENGFGVIDSATGVIIDECLNTSDEAEGERDQYLREMHAFNAGPFSDAQCRPAYNAAAVDKAIACSRQKIGGKEAKLIHALLRGA